MFKNGLIYSMMTIKIKQALRTLKNAMHIPSQPEKHINSFFRGNKTVKSIKNTHYLKKQNHHKNITTMKYNS